MSKQDKSSSERSGYEVIDEKVLRETVELFVDFAQERELPARLVMLAMEHIAQKIKSYLEIEVVAAGEGNGTVH